MRMRIGLTSMAAVLALTAASHATLLTDVTFTGNTPDQTPPVAGAVAGGVTTTVQYANPSTGDADLHAWVRNSGYPTVGDGTVLQLYDNVITAGANQAQTRFYLNAADVVSNVSAEPVVTISWDMLRDNSLGAAPLFLNLRTLAGVNMTPQIAWSSGGNYVTFDGIQYASEFNQAYSYAIQLDYANDTVSLFIDDNLQNTIAFDSNISFGRVEFSTSTSGRSIIVIDNFQIETSIPEPGSIALMGLGGLAILFRRKR